MENILIIDTETTGIDVKKCKLIEVGAILYSVKHRTILQTLSSLFPCEENPAEFINAITKESTQAKMNRAYFVPMLNEMCESASFLVAHNAAFDKKFLDIVSPQPLIRFSDRLWICTKDDFKWPVKLFRNRLQDICTAMGVEYTKAHRALGDCNLLVECLSKVEDLEKRLNSCKSSVFDELKYR